MRSDAVTTISRRAALLSLPFAALGSVLAHGQTAEGVKPYEAKPGDAVQYRIHRRGDDEETSCWRTFAGRSGGRITVHVTCDNGFSGTSILDAGGNLVHEETRQATYDYKPHNHRLPAEPLRVGLSWNGTYQIVRNGRPRGWASKDCSVSGAAPYKLAGFPGTLTGYAIECSFGRTSDAKLGSIRYTAAYVGSVWPITVKSARSRAIAFKPASDAAAAQ